MSKKVKITVYRWGGAWGPFKVNIPCGECSLTKDIIADVLENDLAHIPVKVSYFDWLTFWYKPLLKGGWHAPIVMVGDKIISQGKALNRGLLIEAIIGEWTQNSKIKGTHLFGKATCSYCIEAKKILKTKKIDYEYHDVIKQPQSLYEMLARVKPIIGPKTPVTVPQIWIDGKYIGGCDDLKKLKNKNFNRNK